MKINRVTLILAVMFVAAVITGVLNGAARIPAEELFRTENRVVLDMRLMRIAAAILAGAGLSAAGIALQAILRNPLAEPYLLGTSSGAGLAAVIAIVTGISRIYMPAFSFLGAIGSIFIVYILARDRHRITESSLILAGVIVSVALSALIVVIVSVYPERTVHEITWWLWGSLQVYDYRLLCIVAVPVALGTAGIFLFSRDLNAISLGEEEAMHLGINADMVKKIVLFFSAVITASLICICGIIGFVGLIIPHMMRLITGPDHKTLIPVSCAAAGVFMIACDVLGRTVFSPVEIPIGVITAIIGAPVFMILLKKGRRLQ